MDISIIFYILIVLGIGTVIFLLVRKKPEETKKEDNSLLMIQQQMSDIIKSVDKKLADINEITRSELNKNSGVLKNVSEEMVRFGQTGKQVLGFTEQLQSFQNIWSNQKRRGIQGEMMMEAILKNILPSSMYKSQYQFKNGDIVDAVILVEADKMIPIDSKFPYDSYNQAAGAKDPIEKDKLEKTLVNALKKQIDEASKYVRINENTLACVLMYIPADGIYADLFENEVGSIKSYTRDLMTYAHQKNVIPVSPNMLYAQLKIILHGLKMWQLDKKTLEIRKIIGDLGRHLIAYKESFGKIGKYLDLSVKSYLDARNNYRMIGKDIERITEGETQINAEGIDSVERPMLDES